MCLSPFKIKSVNPVSPRLAFLPCGKCEQCRNSHKSAWSMRLSLELQVCKQKGWSVGFCTLTYSDEHLPHFDVSSLDKDFYRGSDLPLPSQMPACFDKKQVRDFVVNLRRDLDSDYGAHGLKYMICSEYGDSTARPHYHCVFSWPPEISDRAFFDLICKYWRFGFVYPRYFTGGRDSHGYEHKPFVVAGDSRFAAAYAGKYCCKDISFKRSLNGFRFNKRSAGWKNGDCFHIQNKSLGLSWLVGKSDQDLVNALFKGVGFAGDENLHQLPLYLRNKIFFNPVYIVERKVFDPDGIAPIVDGSLLKRSDDSLKSEGYRVEYRRLVRRECTSFFHEHYSEIFRRKVDFWEKTFSNLSSVQFFPLLHFPESYMTPEYFSSSLNAIRGNVSFRDLAEFYVSRYGILQSFQFDKVKSVDLWAMRYTLKDHVSLFRAFPRLDEHYVKRMSFIVDMYLGVLGLSFATKTELDKKVSFLKECFKHKEY